MKSKFVFAFLVVACTTITTAQVPSFQRLPYYPNIHRPVIIRGPYYLPPNRGPQIYRAKRDIFGGKLSSNPNGGADALLTAGAGLGSPNNNLAGTVFAAGNTQRGPVATGGSLGYNLNGHGVSLSKTHIPGVGDITSQNAKLNLLNNDRHNLDLNAFKSDTRLTNGFEFAKKGANLDYSNINGFGGKFGISKIPNLGTTYEAAAKANLWKSPDRQTSLDLTATASRIRGGPFNGQNNYGATLGLTHLFG